MYIIGLTGGIGSGKSTVARMLARAGFEIVDADQIAREIVEPGQPALAELAQAFGHDILAEDGLLKRGELAARAFSNKENTEKLNSITHPRIREETHRRFSAASSTVIYDMPLLIEQGLHHDMDLTIVVETPAEIRLQRLVEDRGMNSEDAKRRIHAQASDAQRRAAADILLTNSGSREQLKQQVEKIIPRLRGEDCQEGVAGQKNSDRGVAW